MRDAHGNAASLTGQRKLEIGVKGTPEPLQAGKTAEIRVTIKNIHAEDTVQFKAVRMHFGLGTGPTDLVENEAKANDVKVTKPRRWPQSTKEKKGNSFHVEFTGMSQTLGPGDEATVVLNGVQVNSAEGSASFHVTCECQHGTEPDPEKPFPLQKGPTSFVLTDFRPRNLVVDAGTKAELVWKHTEAGNIGVHLIWTDDGGEHDEIVTKERARACQVWRDTVFRLRALRGSPALDHSLYTFVTVPDPHLTVNTLTVNGQVTALRHRRFPTEPELVPPPYLEGEHTRRYTAQTDGTLFGSVKALEARTRVTATVAVTRERHTHRTRVSSLGSAEDTTTPGRSFSAPVPSGSTIEVTWEVTNRAPAAGGVDRSITFEARLDWNAMSHGMLVPAD